MQNNKQNQTWPKARNVKLIENIPKSVLSVIGEIGEAGLINVKNPSVLAITTQLNTLSILCSLLKNRFEIDNVKDTSFAGTTEKGGQKKLKEDLLTHSHFTHSERDTFAILWWQIRRCSSVGGMCVEPFSLNLTSFISNFIIVIPRMFLGFKILMMLCLRLWSLSISGIHLLNSKSTRF